MIDVHPKRAHGRNSTDEVHDRIVDKLLLNQEVHVTLNNNSKESLNVFRQLISTKAVTPFHVMQHVHIEGVHRKAAIDAINHEYLRCYGSY